AAAAKGKGWGLPLKLQWPGGGLSCSLSPRAKDMGPGFDTYLASLSFPAKMNPGESWVTSQ
uniref:Uncharacterized protein n=1 Tax=Crocodylus porosus TaxID=8502 RepID=A0A7M4F078_CROPO